MWLGQFTPIAIVIHHASSSRYGVVILHNVTFNVMSVVKEKRENITEFAAVR